MPFVKGQSGNPGGRPKELREVVALARRYTPDAIRALARITNSTKAPPAAVVAASVALLDRGWGKAVQPVIADAAPLEEERRAVREAMMRELADLAKPEPLTVDHRSVDV